MTPTELREFAAKLRQSDIAPTSNTLTAAGYLDAAAQELESQQAKIDALMLEFCPEALPPAQLEEWARHQQPVAGTEVLPSKVPQCCAAGVTVAA